MVEGRWTSNARIWLRVRRTFERAAPSRGSPVMPGQQGPVIGVTQRVTSRSLSGLSTLLTGGRPDAAPYAPPVSFTVGFDLDMTLIDPRAGIVEVFDVLAAETGIPLDGRAFVTRLGPPLRHELERYGLDEATVTELVDRYRALTPELTIPRTIAMPGAVEAVRAVTDRGGRAVVVTTKFGPNAQAHLDYLGIEVSAVVGDLWSAAKAVALQELGAEVFVGDHLGDITGARAADAFAVGVATGPISAEDLLAAGADVVLPDLTHFPGWLESYLLATVH